MYHGDPKQATEEIIKKMTALFPYFQAVAKIARKWNGKVYNKNFNDDVWNETDHKIYVSYGRYDDEINCHGNISSYSDYMQFFYIHKKDLPDGKRIDAKMLIDEMKKNLTRYYNEVESLKKALLTIDAEIKEITALRDEARTRANAIPVRIRDFYNIDYKY